MFLKSEYYKSAFNNTYMFLIGVVFGIILNLTFHAIRESVDPTMESKRYAFLFGILQIFMNGFVIRLSTEKINGKLGLFSLGLLSAQKLIIKELY